MKLLGYLNRFSANLFGIQVHSIHDPYWREAAFERRVLAEVADYTMTSHARIIALVRAISYVARNGIPGDIVECGVWRGGSMMAAARALQYYGLDRSLWLYDTYQGMSTPTAADAAPDGTPAAELLKRAAPGDWVLAYASLQEVKNNLARTHYPSDRVQFIVGNVEDTLRRSAPERIALLRLDTDWYESTKVELEQLWPRLSTGGILILDDYGHWSGARKAVDEYFGDVFMDRIDDTGRIIIKS